MTQVKVNILMQYCMSENVKGLKVKMINKTRFHGKTAVNRFKAAVNTWCAISCSLTPMIAQELENVGKIEHTCSKEAVLCLCSPERSY